MSVSNVRLARTRRSIRVMIAALSILLFSSAVFSCGDSGSEKLTAAKLSEGCLINSDCTTPLVCAFRRCHSECTTSRDCAVDQRCVAADRPFRVCQLDDERDCMLNSDCPAPMLCGIDGECRDQCATERDCVSGQVCVGGVCAEPEELTDAGELPQNTDLPDGGATGASCVYTSQCPDPLVCRNGACVAECREDRDCRAGSSCVGGECVLAPGGCTYNSDCSTPGQICVGNVCQCWCQSDTDCPTGLSCDGCGCVESDPVDGGADAGGCIYNSDCANASEICSGGQCRCQCRVTRDCPYGTECDGCGCVTPDAGAQDGGADVSVGCVYNSDCATPGEICSGGQCRCECRQDRDCLSGMVCDGCGCRTAAPDGAPDGFGSGCAVSSDCTAPLVCIGGLCVYECNVTADCGGALGVCCAAHRCTTGSACGTTTDGGFESSDGCRACLANYDCDDGLFCNGQERCNAGCCAPALDTPCNSHSSCIRDLCDEATDSCSQVLLAPEDVDGDGHLSLGCEGGDDCNDDDPDIYTGALEICDGKDNDCNQLEDDGSRYPYGVELSSPPTTYQDIAVPVGQSWLVASAKGPTVAVERYTRDGTSTGSIYDLTEGGFLLAASGGATHAALHYYQSSCCTYVNQHHYLAVLSEDLTFTTTTDLGSGATASWGDADIVWTGTDFFMGWVGDGVTPLIAQVSRIATDGTLRSGSLVPTSSGTGVLSTGAIRVAASGSFAAAAYIDAGVPSIAVFSGGLPKAGPVALPATGNTPSIYAVGGLAAGFVVVWADDGAAKWTVFDTNGVLGATLPLPGGGAGLIDGDGASDGVGAMFALDFNGTERFGYARPGYPFELTTALSESGSNHIASISGYPGFYGISYANNLKYSFREVGCPPPPTSGGDGGVSDAGAD